MMMRRRVAAHRTTNHWVVGEIVRSRSCDIEDLGSKNVRTLNPAREVRKVRYATAGFHTWSVDEVRQFEERHPIGTKARLALALLLYLGVRRGDVVTLGRQHVKDGRLRMVPRKTRHERLEPSLKPVLARRRRKPDRRSDLILSPNTASL
jgi:integrase